MSKDDRPANLLEEVREEVVDEATVSDLRMNNTVATSERTEASRPGSNAGSARAIDRNADEASGSAADKMSPVRANDLQRYVQTACLVVIALLMVGYSLYVTRAFMLPVTAAILLNFVLSPLVKRLNRIGIPSMAGAAIVMTALTASTAFGVYQLQKPAAKWLDSAPDVINELSYKLKHIRTPAEEIVKASKQVEELAQNVQAPDVVKVDVQRPSLASVVLSHSSAFAAGLLLSGTLLFFLLASGDHFLAKCVELTPTFSGKRRIVDASRDVQRGIAHYLGTVTTINTVLGVVMAITLWCLGVPNAALWGVMAAVLNYVPFFGLIVGTAIVFLVSLLTFDSLGQAAVPAVVYLVINSVEANLITPAILGRSMSMNPVAILLWMMLCGWMWGIAGAIIAIPILAMLMIACEATETLAPVAKFIAK